METKLKHIVLTVLFTVLSLNAMAQIPASAEEKRAALLTPQYYTNWIGASFFTISGIEKDCDVTPVHIHNLTFFYDFGNCFVGMTANEIGVITQMTFRLFADDAAEFVDKAIEYGYEKVGNGKNLNVRSNTRDIIPDIYDSDVTQYCKQTKNGKVYLEVANSGKYPGQYEIAIFRTQY